MSSITQIRNLEYHPYIESEGEFKKWLPRPPNLSKDHFWFDNLKPHDRLFYHQTLNSSRRFAGFKAYPKVPKDSLDLVLQSQYEHQNELFPDKPDIVLQHETVGRKTFRRIRNTRDLKTERIIAIGHPLTIGGISDRISPNSVKLMCSGHHTPLTNPGYSRQGGDGNYFNY